VEHQDPAAIFESLSREFGEAVIALDEEGKDPFIQVAAERIADICFFLKTRPELHFDSLICLSGVDWEEKFQMVYHLHSLPHGHRLVLKADLGRENPELPSVSGVWRAANWHERETYDLFGITFSGHPDLERLFMPEDWVGHPLRKDYEEPEEYGGISHRREALIQATGSRKR